MQLCPCSADFSPLVVNNGALVNAPESGRLLLKRPLLSSVATMAVGYLQRLGFTPYASRYSVTGPDLFFEQAPPRPPGWSG